MPIHIPAELSAHLQALPTSRGERMASLTDWAIVRLLDAAVDHVGLNNIVAIVEAAFDKYIAPLVNIPGVSDETIKSVLVITIRGFHALVHREGPMMGAAQSRTWIGEAA